MNTQQHPTPQPLPALAPQTLGAYIGSRVIASLYPAQLVEISLNGCRAVGSAPFGYFAHSSIRLQLRRVGAECLTATEIVELFKHTVPTLASWHDDALQGVFLANLNTIRTQTPYVDWLRARGFDCGGFDENGTWHPSLIEAGLADELVTET